MSAILIVGNPVGGFTYTGPFETRSDAADYADTVGVGGDWWVSDIELPAAWVSRSWDSYVPTHYSLGDGSQVMALTDQSRAASGHFLAVNEDGCELECKLSEWSPIEVEHTCMHCARPIVRQDGVWVDPLAGGDDIVWRETCDSHDTFVADHEPEGESNTCRNCDAPIASGEYCTSVCREVDSHPAPRDDMDTMTNGGKTR